MNTTAPVIRRNVSAKAIPEAGGGEGDGAGADTPSLDAAEGLGGEEVGEEADWTVGLARTGDATNWAGLLADVGLPGCATGGVKGEAGMLGVLDGLCMGVVDP